MANQNQSVGIAIAVAVAILMGVILIQIIADQTANKVQNELVTDSFRLIRDGPGGLYNVSNGINESRTFSLTKVDDAWRQDISECSLDTTIDSNRITAYNSTGGKLDMNGCGAGGDYYVVDNVNAITFCNSVNTNYSTSTTATVKYTTCPTEYVGGWAQTVFKLIPGFFALAILIGAAFVIFKVLKEEGVDLQI